MGNFARRLDHGAVVLGEFATTTPEMKGVDFAGRLGRRLAAPSFVQKVLVNLSTCPPVGADRWTGLFDLYTPGVSPGDRAPVRYVLSTLWTVSLPSGSWRHTHAERPRDPVPAYQ
jgi:hypothetical protein